jgi:hypothetical protein
MSLELAIQAVEKGLAWLKESGPIYGLDVDQVDIGRLNLKSTCDCVLGQLGQSYCMVMETLITDGVIKPGEFARIDWAAEHGFDRGFPDSFQGSYGAVDYHHLDEAWRLVLEADRAQ